MAAVDFQVRNGIIANTYVTVGNSSVNAVINSTSISFGGTGTSVNTATVYATTANVTTLNATTANVTTSNPVTLNVNGTATFTGTVSSQANTLNQTLTDGATINWDVSQGQIATVTLAGNRTIAAPTNLKVTTYLLHVIQDGTGSRTLTWNSIFKWPAGTAPPLSTAASSRDIFSFVSDGTYLYGSFLPNVK